MTAKWKIQSLKRSTFPFLRSLAVRSPCVHRPFTVRSWCVHRSLIVRSPFTVLRSPFSVRSRSPFTKRSSIAHRSFSYRSQNVHRSLIVHKAFSHFHSELRRERTVLKLSVQNSNKMRNERVRKGGRKLSLYIRNLILTYKASGLSTVKIQRKLQSTHQFITSRQGIRNFINRHKKTGSVVDQRYGGFFLSETFHFFVVYIMRYFPSFV